MKSVSYTHLDVYKRQGGYNGTQETKTLPGFFFKLYLRSDLEKTDKLMKKEDGSYDYVTFFKENPDAAFELAIEWDLEKYDADGDMTTVHANRGGGKMCIRDSIYMYDR